MRICGRHIVLLALTSLTLAACGGDEDVRRTATAETICRRSSRVHLPPRSRPGRSYSFTPTAADPDGDPITFRATNVPAWATFNTTHRRTDRHADRSQRRHDGHDHHRSHRLEGGHAVAGVPHPGEQQRHHAAAGQRGARRSRARPATTATVGQAYTFTPVGDDANGDTLTFTHPEPPDLAHLHARDRPSLRHARHRQHRHHEQHRDHGERRPRRHRFARGVQPAGGRGADHSAGQSPADHHRHSGDHRHRGQRVHFHARSAAIPMATRSCIPSRTSRAGRRSAPPRVA